MCRARCQPKIQGFYQKMEPKGHKRDSGKLSSGGYCGWLCLPPCISFLLSVYLPGLMSVVRGELSRTGHYWIGSSSYRYMLGDVCLTISGVSPFQFPQLNSISMLSFYTVSLGWFDIRNYHNEITWLIWLIYSINTYIPHCLEIWGSYASFSITH